MNDILEINRQHWPGNPRLFNGLKPAPTHENDCRVVLGEEIRQYYARGPERWAEYQEIVREFARRRLAGGREQTLPYGIDTVFAPTRVVIAESDRPIRCYITHEPVYPARGKLGILRLPWASTQAYVAVAVLNSAIGLALYHEFFELIKGQTSKSSDGLIKEVLQALPIAHRSSSYADLNDVARFSYALGMMYAAEDDCKEDFSEYTIPLRYLLLKRIGILLRLDDDQVDHCVELARLFNAPDAPSPQLRLVDALEQRPLRDRIIILHDEERKRFDQLVNRGPRDRMGEADLRELSRLGRKWTWEKLINAFSGKDAPDIQDHFAEVDTADPESPAIETRGHIFGTTGYRDADDDFDPFELDPLLSQVVFNADPSAPIDLEDWPEAFG